MQHGRSFDKNEICMTGLVLVLVIAILLFTLMPMDLETEYSETWLTCTVSLTVSLFALIILYYRCDVIFFSPVVYVALIYLVMFFATPIYDIYNHNTSIFGVTDLFQYGQKSTLYALLGFLSFCAVYGWRQSYLNKKLSKPDQLELTEQDCDKLSHILLAAWVVLFIVAVTVTALQKGFSVEYIISFGILGETNEYNTSTTSLGFIAQFTRSIVTVFCLYYFYSKNKLLKYLLLVLTILVEIINGFRYMAAILLIALYYITYLKAGKRFSLFKALGVLAVLAIMIGFVGYSRLSVQKGEGMNVEGFSYEKIMDAILGNFRIYKAYYGVVKAVPQMVKYLYFDQILVYTAIMIIPRAIWNNKPGNPGTLAQYYGINEYAVKAGFAYPCLGEYYYSFGVMGVIILMGIFGGWLAKLDAKYRIRSRCPADYVYYSVILASTLQLLIRGYTPSNFYLLVTLSVPYWAAIRFIKSHALKNAVS